MDRFRAWIRRTLFRTWEEVRSSMWLVPAALGAAALLVARAAVAADERDLVRGTALDPWMYSGTVDGARGILSALAGALITVSGVVFSITIVALSFASAHLGPRLLRNFRSDRHTQVALGTFVGVFLYCLTVLSSLRGTEDAPFVPRLAITLGLVWTVLAFGVLVHFLHDISRKLQADDIVVDVRRHLERRVASAYPADVRAAHPSPTDLAGGRPVRAPRSGYVQAIDVELLERLAAEREVRVVCTRRPGQFVLAGVEVARAHGARCGEDDARELSRAVVVGPDRTDAQDVEFAVRQLVEIALRALSPGVNDPFTAIACIDHLSAALADLMQRPAPGWRYAGAGERVVVPQVTFEDVLDTAWRQLRQHGADQPAVAIRLLEALEALGSIAPDPARARAVRRHVELVREAAERAGYLPSDRADLERRARAALAAAGGADGADAAADTPGTYRGVEHGRARA